MEPPKVAFILGYTGIGLCRGLVVGPLLHLPPCTGFVPGELSLGGLSLYDIRHLTYYWGTLLRKVDDLKGVSKLLYTWCRRQSQERVQYKYMGKMKELAHGDDHSIVIAWNLSRHSLYCQNLRGIYIHLHTVTLPPFEGLEHHNIRNNTPRVVTVEKGPTCACRHPSPRDTTVLYYTK